MLLRISYVFACVLSVLTLFVGGSIAYKIYAAQTLAVNDLLVLYLIGMSEVAVLIVALYFTIEAAKKYKFDRYDHVDAVVLLATGVFLLSTAIFFLLFGAEDGPLPMPPLPLVLLLPSVHLGGCLTKLSNVGGKQRDARHSL